MKKITALLTLASFFVGQTAPLMAWVGGPYSGNTYDGFQGGVFQYTLSMKNGMGMARFASSLEAMVSPFAQGVVFHEGITYYGESFGMIDTVSSTASGIINGLSAPANSITGAPQNAGVPNTFRNSASHNYVANVAWNGKITNKRPTIRFKGKGFAYFFDENYEDTSTTSIDSVEATVEIPGPPGTDPGVRTSSTVQTITSAGLPPMVKKKVKVFGGRISPIAYAVATPLTASPDGRN
jgi:hypothetical protein